MAKLDKDSRKLSKQLFTASFINDKSAPVSTSTE